MQSMKIEILAKQHRGVIFMGHPVEQNQRDKQTTTQT